VYKILLDSWIKPEIENKERKMKPCEKKLAFLHALFSSQGSLVDVTERYDF
jgi:hypothetical protein